MIVLKFGGSSVADATRISAMMDIVHEALLRDKVLVVCSAISGCTDYLLNNEEFSPLFERHCKIINRLFTGVECIDTTALIADYFDDLKTCPREDRVTFGEIFSTLIIASRFVVEEVETEWIDSRDLIKVNPSGNVLEELSYSLIRAEISKHPSCRLFVAPGFIASTLDGEVTTLGRGGSDYSAALYAAAVGASELQIWTDVPGIMTANPKLVPDASTVSYMSYASAFTLAENGAKVLYAPTVQPAMDSGIAINIRNTFDPANPGTIVSVDKGIEQWCGVSTLKFEDKLRLCVVGENLSSRQEGANRIIIALNEAGISPLSEVYGSDSVFFVDLSLLVEKEALEAVHREFFVHSSPKTIDVYIAGYGAVGKALCSLIEEGSALIALRTGKSLCIAGICDHNLELSDASSFIETINSRNAVFVDCTNDETLYTQYEKLFRKGVNIVTSNRRSIAIPYTKYAALKNAARSYGCFFRYDTTVGTSLPFLESISEAANCGDEIESIEAVVSCTMNNLFSSYTGEGRSFASLLRSAQESGLTEEDPRIDIGGRDVLRKLLIIAREAGVRLEESDVLIHPLLDASFFDCPLDEFYSRLEVAEPLLSAKAKLLSSSGLRQRFVASLHRDASLPFGYKAEIRMCECAVDSPFYWINGTENVIVIRSAHSAPLVIKGAGEGAKQAAIGLIKDILL